MNRDLPELHFITRSDGTFTDYRPAVDRTGDQVVFERSAVPNPNHETFLNVISVSGSSDPRRLIADDLGFRSQTRPDWSWEAPDFRLIFNAAHCDTNLKTVWLANGNGTGLVETGLDALIYPQWLPGGAGFVAMNRRDLPAHITPRSSAIDLSTRAMIQNVNGRDAEGNPFYAGMPAVRPNGAADTPLIAFAGQPTTGWLGPAGYREDKNYIFLNGMNPEGSFTSVPMEPGARLSRFDPAHQGRAPAWSPDGATIAFESNRDVADGKSYAIHLCDLRTGAVIRVTEPRVDAQHAKFFPCGTKLILCALSGPQADFPTRGIAWVDLRALLNRDA